MIRRPCLAACVALAVLPFGCGSDPTKTSPDANVTPTPDAPAAICGDRVIAAGEECDDGNVAPGDGCDAACQREPRCGDGFVDDPEACDDGNDFDDDACTITCRLTNLCGNGTRDGAEACDDGNQQAGDGCSAVCTLEPCGNGTLDGAEQCDDGNGAANDGCSPQCTSEAYGWRAPEPAYNGPSFAFDATAGKSIYWSGDFMYQWDGNAWQGSRTISVSSTTPLTGPMVYDSTRGVLVLLPTFGNGVAHPWEWNGTTWVERVAAGAPARDRDVAVTFDSARGVMVVFGLAGSNTLYEWNGTSWRSAAPTVRPPVRTQTQMAFDATRARTVVFSGAPNFFTAPVADTWEWDGTTWTQVMGAAPPARINASMIFDPSIGKIRLVGGSASLFASLADMWTYDGSWSPTTVASVPPAPRLAFDTTRARLVAFTPGSQLWEWDGTSWQLRRTSRGVDADGSWRCTYDQERHVAQLYGYGFVEAGTDIVYQPMAIGVRRSHAAAYDAYRRQLVLFGGTIGPANEIGPANDTWLWNGLAWRQVMPATRPPRLVQANAVYDAKRRRVILFGGSDPFEGMSNATWSWDGSNWQKLMPAAAPPPRVSAQLAYDPLRDRIVMFGGFNGTALTDTWEFDGATWLPTTPAQPITSGVEGNAWFDPVAKRIVYAGRDPNQSDRMVTWAWNGSTWQNLSTQVGAPQASAGCAFFDAQQKQLVFAGRNGFFELGYR